MNLEYFYNSIQLFGVLLGLTGVFIAFKIQSLDTSISSYRNNLVTAIAQYEAVKTIAHCEENKIKKDESCNKTYDELVRHFLVIFNGGTDEDLQEKVEKIKVEKDSIGNFPKKYLSFALDRWVEENRKKIKIKSSVRCPVFLSGIVILLGLSIVTYNSFKLVNYISEISFMSGIVFIFIIWTFVSIVYMIKYIYDSLK